MIEISKEHIPMLFIAFLMALGIYKAMIQEEVEKRIGNRMRKLYGNAFAEQELRKAGAALTVKNYYLILYFVTGLLLLFSLVKALRTQSVQVLLFGLLIDAFIIWYFRPAEFLFGTVQSPFKTLTGRLSKARMISMDREIYSSCIVLKNLAIVQKNKPLSADIMYETLANSADKLKPVYQEMISLYRTGRRAEAFKFFQDSIGTVTARSYAGLLSKLDRINPNELLNQVESLIEAMSEKRMTDRYKRAQTNGLITMSVSTIVIMIALVNFLIVVMYLDMIGELGTLNMNL